MGKIQLLDPKVVNLIAAGEVVERPASVVKELIENSIDAGADNIVVRIVEGGTAEITVIDNGSGMDQADAELAFTQHATSKVVTAEDLNNIISLGFRGEALASISSVAYIETDTKAADQPSVQVKIQHGEITSSPSTRSNQGTRIAIRNLFQNIPARQKFLRTATTEFGYINDVFQSISLSHPGIHFELYHNDKLVHRLPLAKDLPERVFQLWGEKISHHLFIQKLELSDWLLTAYIGNPEIARKDRKLQFIYVNGRYISDRIIQRAIVEAYRGFIHKDLQPVYFLDIKLPTTEVDINVHPRKQEVKFRDSNKVYRLVFDLVSKLLHSETKSAILNRTQSQSEIIAPTKITNFSAGQNPPIHSNFPSFGENSFKFVSRDNSPTKHSVQRGLDFTATLLREPDNSSGRDEVIEDSRELETRHSKYLQVFATYIVYEQGDNLVFVDQHAAAEKILYEKLSSGSDIAASQQLLVPEILEFTPQDKEQILNLSDELKQSGISIADFGGNSIQVTHKPVLTPHLDIEGFLQGIISTPISKQESDFEFAIINPRRHHLLATMACHGSIRAGQHLSSMEMAQLLKDLAKCDTPYNCPHGRPVSWVMPKYELEKNFKRVI